MKTLITLLTLALLSGCISSTSSISTGKQVWFFYSEDPASPLANTWTFTQNQLICSGQPRGYLFTEKEYTNFKLSLEFQRPAGATENRGGILLRKTGDDKIWPKCLEAQINAPNAGDFVSIGGFNFISNGPEIKTIEHPALGEILILPKSAQAEKPNGEWNLYEINAYGDKVTITLNGVLVNTALACDIIPGRICLTSEGDPIKFRNISITELP